MKLAILTALAILLSACATESEVATWAEVYELRGSAQDAAVELEVDAAVIYDAIPHDDYPGDDPLGHDAGVDR